MMTLNYPTIEQFVNDHKKGTFGVCMVSITAPTLSGGKKCPYLGRILKVTYTKNAILGISYEGAIKGAEQRSGIEVGTFQASKLPWGEWTDYPYVIEHKETKYLRLFQNKATKLSSHIYLDGELIEKGSAKYDEILPYLPKKSVSVKQEEAGIDEEERVVPLTYKFDSVCYLAQSGRGYIKNLGIEMDTDIIEMVFKGIK